jgi:hypothetical protein
MADELVPVLARFYREVIAPDINRIVTDAFGSFEERMNARFEALCKRFDRLEAEARLGE